MDDDFCEEVDGRKVCKVKFAVGKPVKARKYYDTRTGEFERADNGVYGIGTETDRGIQYSSDLRNVQASNSSRLFVYGKSYEELEELKKGLKGVGRTRKVKVYHGGKPVPALETVSMTRSNRLELIGKMAKKKGLDVEYYPEVDKKHLTIWTEEEE